MGQGLRVLPHAELQELSLLYRQMAADLATVREDPSGRQTAEYLNRLLGRAHNVIYGGSKVKGRSVRESRKAGFARKEAGCWTNFSVPSRS